MNAPARAGWEAETLKVPQEDGLLFEDSEGDDALAADALLVRQLHCGDAEAGRRFVRDYYPGIYRYLLYLTGRPETAEDLTQETFVKAWQNLDRFVVRAPLGAWLHRIAHREFLQALRRQRSQTSVAELEDLAEPRAAGQTEAVELRELIQTLPIAEREAVVLHYLHGYTCEEIAPVVRAPVTTVKYRLSAARAHLQRELGEGDMAYLNEPGLLMRRWAWLPLDQMSALEARFSMKEGERKMNDRTRAGMSRRKLLEAAGTAAAAVAAAGLPGPAETANIPQDPAEIIDDRLTRKVTLSLKATALADLCARLQVDTGIQIAANPSVADEKVTLFCEKRPLREVMRQLSRPFGYTWLRSGEASGVGRWALGKHADDPNAQRPTPVASYRYELTQDLRSQLLEEELQNRDRHEALLSLEREIEKYRPYLELSPDEAQARAKTAAPEEKRLLETLAGKGWGVIQMYFRLSPGDLAALRTGETVTFSADPKPGEQPLPPDVARGVLQSWSDWRIAKRGDQFEYDEAKNVPDGLPPSAVPEAQAKVVLKLEQSELGQFTIDESGSGFTISGGNSVITGFPIAVGTSPAVRSPANEVANARLARDPALRPAVSIEPQPSCHAAKGGAPAGERPEASDTGSGPEPKVTSADLLEALHRATRLPVIADFYTHLYPPGEVSLQNQPLFHALSQLADAMHLRWRKEDEWLQFRSAGYYNDRLKEVPNRLLSRWAAARATHGSLTLDDLVEIAQLPDSQLDAGDMAEGARECWGLAEWDLARNKNVRAHLRFLASLTPAQRQAAMSPAGLSFAKMTLAQQQQFISLVDPQGRELHSLADLAEATLHVDYTLPGWFQWRPPQDLLGPGWPPLRPAPVRERSREAALQAARRIDPQVTEAQVSPTEPDLAFIYTWGSGTAREVRWVRPNGQWGRRLNSG